MSDNTRQYHPLPHTASLEGEGDLAARMVEGLHRYLLRQTEAAPARRAKRWKTSTRAVAAKRQHLHRLIGAVDERLPPALQLLSDPAHPGPLSQGPEYQVWALRWPVFRNVEGEGLLLRPTGRPRAAIVALPDCDWTPEQLAGLAPGVPSRAQFARRLAEAGCQVLAPCLIDRGDTYSGNSAIRMTNQPHREFIYRAAFELGRHLIGFEVQKIAAALDCLAPDEWVAYEFARTKRRYVLSGLGERAQIEFFDGPHTIHGQGTFRFLEEQLNWAGVGRGQRGGNAKRRPGRPVAGRPRRA